MLIVPIVVLILLFGGGGGYYYGRGAGWRGPHYGGGLLGLVLIILLNPVAERDDGPGDVALSAERSAPASPTRTDTCSSTAGVAVWCPSC